MKKLIGALIAGAIAVVAFSAQSVATDTGGAIVNHASGVITFPYGKLLNSKNVCVQDGGLRSDGGPNCANQWSATVNYYDTIAEYPTVFVAENVVFDGGTLLAFDGGCQKFNLAEQLTRTSARAAGKTIFCNIELPLSNLDAGVFAIYKSADGGYGFSQCPAQRALTANQEWSAFCRVQNGTSPVAP